VGLLPDLGADESDGGTLIPGRTATPIAVGETKSGTAPAGGFSDFVLTLAPGQVPSLRVLVEAPGGVAGLRLLVRHRQFSLPTLFDFEGTPIDATSTEVIVPAPLAGAWYLSVLSTAGEVPFTISASRPGAVRGVTAISPTSGGTAGTVTSRITGFGFEAGCRVELRTAGVALRSYTPEQLSATEMGVRLDLSGLAPGTRDVAVVWPDGEERLLPQAFTILSGGSASLAVRLVVPETARPERGATIVLEYENTGSVDLPAPVLSIVSREGLGMRLSPKEAFVRGPLNVLGIDHEGVGTAGTLPPHARQWIVFQVFCEGSNHTKLGFRVDSLIEPALTSVDWPAQEPSFRPPAVPLDGWARLWESFVADVGPTWGHYATALRRAADALSERGRFVHGTSRLLALRMSALSGNLLRGDLAVGPDAQAPSPGPPLALARVFPADLLARFRVGPWGRGWANLYWDVSAVEHTEGDVQIRASSGGVRGFVPLGGGHYRGSAGDPGTLSKTAAGFTLTERGGTIYRFRLDGRLASVEDRFENAVQLGYDGGGRLISLAHSDGDVFSLEWNGAGRVTRLTDHVGKQTLYGYDATWEHLVTVTSPAGLVTRYSYTLGGGATDHALASITLPDGRARFFSYDEKGRNASRWSSGDLERVSFESDSLGGITTRDGLGTAASAGFDEYGRFARLVDPDGEVAELEWDDLGNLVRAVTPGGAVGEMNYGPLGNAELFIDPLGTTVAARYAYPATGGATLTSLVDPEGFQTRFELDGRNAVRSIVYPDGTTETFGRNAQGLPVTMTSRRGDVVTTTFSARGEVTRLDLPGGLVETFAYDADGRPTRATNALGDVTAEWDARGFPTRATGADGRSTSYQVDDAGRVTRRTTGDGFVVAYAYDAAGRLLNVTDGTGTPFVTYAYDAGGRLVRETKGNGTLTTWTYTAASQVESVVNYGPGGQVLSSFAYVHDAEGNPVGMTTLAGTTSFAYDADGQLVDVHHPDGRRTQIEYDRNGNRTRVVTDATTVPWSSNSLNQATAAGSASFAYDANGNLVQRTDASGTTTYAWNADGRLVQVVHPTLGTFDYEYDALGRRVTERRGTSVRRWAWDGWEVVAEYDGAGALVTRYVSGAGLVARLTGTGSKSFYAFDATGHTRQLTDASGVVVCSYDYDPFGEPLAVSESIPNPFRYAGRFGVLTDAHGLLQMRARSYDPALGRFVSPDPKRFLAGFHFYTYASNSPVRFVDPNGTENPGLDAFNAITGIATNIPGVGGIGYAVGCLTRLPGIPSSMDDINSGRIGSGWLSPHMGVRGLASLGFMTIQTIVGAASLGSATGTTGILVMANPYVMGGAIILAVGEYAIARQIEVYKRFERDFLDHPVKRNLWATFREYQRPDGTYDPAAMKRVAEILNRPELLTPGDPNGKYGTPGAGPSRRVHVGDTLSYTLFFQNVPTAGAPAQEVFLDDLVDPSLDLSTLRVAEIGWGAESVLPPPDTASFALRTRVPDWRAGNAKPWWVDVASELGAGGRLRFTFRTIDPETGELPEDPLAGFLPPDDPTGRGQGWVTFTARTKTGLPTGTRIVNSATIVFDTEAPITTNEVFNTIGLPGDVNDDGVVNPADVFYLVNHFYSAGPPPLGLADVNFDGRVDALDLFYLINYLYAGGPAPQ
jgi:RHS repeat-associated protein